MISIPFEGEFMSHNGHMVAASFAGTFEVSQNGLIETVALDAYEHDRANKRMRLTGQQAVTGPLLDILKSHLTVDYADAIQEALHEWRSAAPERKADRDRDAMWA